MYKLAVGTNCIHDSYSIPSNVYPNNFGVRGGLCCIVDTEVDTDAPVVKETKKKGDVGFRL